MNAMTIDELRHWLKPFPKDALAVVACDEEGNSFSLVYNHPGILRFKEIEDLVPLHQIDEMKEAKVLVIIN